MCGIILDVGYVNVNPTQQTSINWRQRCTRSGEESLVICYAICAVPWDVALLLLSQVEEDTHATDFRNENSPTGLFKIKYF